MWKLVHVLTLVGVAAGVFAAVAQSEVARPRLAHAPLTRDSSPVTFQDSVGEDPAAADITTVTVSNDDNSLITFQINISNRPQLTSDMHVAVFLDTDQNATNGAGPQFEGAELAIDLAQNDVALARWNGSKFDFSAGSPSSLAFAYTNGATIRIKAGDLGVTTFNFWAYTLAGTDPDVHRDYAPDAGHGTWNYQVKITPPPPPPPPTTAQLKLATDFFSIFPKHLKAPGELNAAVVVRRLDTGRQVRTGQVVCKANAGGRPLPLVEPGQFFKGTVNCNWHLPKWAHSKQLKGSITVTFQGAKITRSFTAKIA